MASSNLLGLDVGTVRVGVAIVSGGVSIARSLTTLQRTSDTFWEDLLQIIADNAIQTVVVGLPRGLDGQETQQTRTTRAFASELATRTDIPLVWQDEALTSVKARDALQAGQKPYNKADIDALAASYILADYIEEGSHGSV